MMLGSAELKRRLELGLSDSEDGISIVPSPEVTGSAIDGSASIDLRLGRWFLSIQQTRTSRIDLSLERKGDEFEASEGRMNYVPFGKSFVVHPGRFVLASTLEWLKVPGSLGGLITGKSTIGRRGLVIETAAGLHPHFSGCITLELSNCGEVPVSLVPGMKICQVFLHELKGASATNKTIFGGRRRPAFGNYSLDDFVRRANESARETQGHPDFFPSGL